MIGNPYEIALKILMTIGVSAWSVDTSLQHSQCQHSGYGKLQFMWGDAFEGTDCVGPNGLKYPTEMINNIVRMYKGSLRKGRAMEDPYHVRSALLKAWQRANDESSDDSSQRSPRATITTNSKRSCSSSPGRLCRTSYNTTAPLYGVSLTSGEPVTIVQKFPDLLQQVVFETCTSSECDVIRGRCTQTYVPYLFLVVPLGPVTLTGQDYVMVESGCACKPKFSQDT